MGAALAAALVLPIAIVGAARGGSMPPLGAKAVGAGHGDTCELMNGGGVKCWGWNFAGQLGDETTMDRLKPVRVLGVANDVQAIAVGGAHNCALTKAGGVMCWGNNGSGQLGDGTTGNSATPLRVVGLTSGVKAIAAGGAHTCALLVGGAVKCWGSNVTGQLGIGASGPGTGSTTPVQVSGLSSGVAAIAAGPLHTCAVVAGGAVKCWGSNSDGELGNGTKDLAASPVNVTGLLGVVALALGASHTCALTNAGAVKCWGRNILGALGDGTQNGSTVPVGVFGLSSGVAAIAAGDQHSCALTTGGGVKCWGTNGAAQLGDGILGDRYVPTDVVGLTSRAIALAGGEEHSCAVLKSGVVRCWGYNRYGEVGDGTIRTRETPVNVLPFCKVPGVRSTSLDYAKRDIRGAYCSVGSIRKVYSATARKGRVISQKPAPRSELAQGATVNLVVSKGRKPHRKIRR